MKLSSEQLAKIRAEAIANTLEDCAHGNFLVRVVSKWIDTMTPEAQLEIISSELEGQINVLGFDPTTGKETEE